MKDEEFKLRRREIRSGGTAGLALSAFAAQAAVPSGTPLRNLDRIQTELVMNLVVTCSAPEPMGPNAGSKDGKRSEIWPIIGGRFHGPKIRGVVVPGGGDYPVTRPDGIEVIDALYRLKTDDGVSIIIHNRGLMYPEKAATWPKFRLVPEFTVPVGDYDWLNKSIFLSTLLEVPPSMALAKGPNENDRLIQVHRVF